MEKKEAPAERRCEGWDLQAMHAGMTPEQHQAQAAWIAKQMKADQESENRWKTVKDIALKWIVTSVLGGISIAAGKVLMTLIGKGF